MKIQWPSFVQRNSPANSWKAQLAASNQAAQFYPTPLSIAREILELAATTPDDTVYDPGSGDGRIPILAAQEFGCRAVGIEIDRSLFSHSAARAAELGLADRVRFEQANLFTADYRSATVVTLYLLSIVNEQLQPRLASHLRNGARIVSLDFPIPGWKPDSVVPVRSVLDVAYTLYLYRRRFSGARAICLANNLESGTCSPDDPPRPWQFGDYRQDLPLWQQDAY